MLPITTIKCASILHGKEKLKKKYRALVVSAVCQIFPVLSSCSYMA